MRAIWLDVLTFLTESHAVVDGAVEDWQICCQMLQQSRLLVGIFRFEELIEFLSGDFERRWHNGDWREDGLVVRPHEEDETDVVEHKEEESFDSGIDIIYTKLDHIRVPRPEICTKEMSCYLDRVPCQ